MLLQKNIKLNKLVKTNSSVFSTRTCTVYNVLIIKPVKPGGAGGGGGGVLSSCLIHQAFMALMI